jgi:hypothetical protein
MRAFGIKKIVLGSSYRLMNGTTDRKRLTADLNLRLITYPGHALDRRLHDSCDEELHQ